MWKKTLIQIILILLLIILLIWIYFQYKESSTITISQKKSEVESILKDKNQNIIKDIKYSSNSINGDIYELKADYGEINIDNPDLIFMTNVLGTIKFKESNDIIITSDFANFNNKTYETTFIENVKIVRTNEVVTGDELYLVLDATDNELKINPKKKQNILLMTGNIFFEKPGYNLKTDIVEIDLITKNSKIYMKDELKKVIVNKIN